MKLFLALFMLASGAFAEIPASQWVGEWHCEDNVIILNEDLTCVLKIKNTFPNGTKIIKGHYGIDWIKGYLVVIGDNGQAHIFQATLFDDSHNYNADATANGLIFSGYSWDWEHGKDKNVKRLEFRRI